MKRPRRARTIRQSLALAYGTHHYRCAGSPNGEPTGKGAKDRAAFDKGLALCWACEAEIPRDAAICPECGKDPLPF